MGSNFDFSHWFDVVDNWSCNSGKKAVFQLRKKGPVHSESRWKASKI